MDRPPGEGDSRRISGGRGGKGRGRLGLKNVSLPSPSPPPASSPAPSVPSPPPTTSPAAPTTTPTAVPGSSPAAPASTVPRQGAGWGAVPPNFTSLHGNLQGPNPWLYPPGGFLNMIQQQHYPPQPQLQPENFHLVGQTMPVNPISPPPPPPPSVDEIEVLNQPQLPQAKKQRTIRYWHSLRRQIRIVRWLVLQLNKHVPWVGKLQRLSAMVRARRKTLWKELSTLGTLLRKLSRSIKIGRWSVKRLQKHKLKYPRQI